MAVEKQVKERVQRLERPFTVLFEDDDGMLKPMKYMRLYGRTHEFIHNCRTVIMRRKV